MANRYHVPISLGDFTVKLKELARKYLSTQRNQDIDKSYPNSFEWLHAIPWTTITPKIEKDLSKVEFSDDNYILSVSQFSYEIPTNFLGTQYLGNMPFLGMFVGGNDEHPVYLILYWDGKEIRGYIPDNYKYKDYKKAYPNNSSQWNNDPLNLVKDGLTWKSRERSWYKPTRADWDFAVNCILKDIQERIELKPSKVKS